MDLRVYKGIMRRTIKKEYPLYSLRILLRFLQDQKLIRYSKNRKLEDGVVDVSLIDGDYERIQCLFEKLNIMYKKCEEFDYIRTYRYSYLFRYNSIDFTKIPELITSNRIHRFTNNNVCNDVLKKVIEEPTYKEDEERIYFKFCMQLESKIRTNEPVKHVVLMVIHKQHSLIEIRQDVVPMAYNPIDKFYETHARSARAWLGVMLDAEVDNLDLQAIIRYMKNNKQDDVKITAMELKKDGMRTVLDASTNEKMQLPILDELKNIVLEEIFDVDDNTRAIKNRLDKFIRDIEELSDLPAAKIFWIDEGHQINAYHGETQSELVCLKWIGALKGKESMDYVADYIMQCEREIAEELSD